MDIAERIKKLREIYNITSNDLAKITGIHPVSIRKYETNKMVPGIDVIDKMCEALKLPRMVFEGIPKQYTDYSFAGDFYQQLFLLIANGTLNIDGFINGKDKIETYFTLNQDLSRYIQIKNGSEDIKKIMQKNQKTHVWFQIHLRPVVLTVESQPIVNGDAPCRDQCGTGRHGDAHFLGRGGARQSGGFCGPYPHSST